MNTTSSTTTAIVKSKSASPSLPSSCGTRPLLMVTNFNPEGGFFWQLFNVLHASHMAQKYKLQLVIRMTSGLYLETDAKFQTHYRSYLGNVKDDNNWWNYYFQPVGTVAQHQWLHQLQLQHARIPSMAEFDKVQSSVYQWDRAAFNKRDHPHCNMGVEWARTVHLQPWIDQKWKTLMTNHQLQHTPVIGVHYRGTDKFGDKTSSEDHPVHYNYQDVLRLVSEYMVQHRGTSSNRPAYKIVCASDEQPFIDFMKQQLGADRVVCTDSIRSTMSTSGLLLASWKCSPGFRGPEYAYDPDCRLYKQLRECSIHRGFPDQSKYKKGEDVLLDVLLLSKCEFFFASRGCVSQFPFYINPSLPHADMNQLCPPPTTRVSNS